MHLHTAAQNYTYKELLASPQPLNDPQLVERQHAKQHLGTIGEDPTPCQEPPQLSIAPDVRYDSNRKVVSCVGNRSDQGKYDDPEDKGL